MEKVSKKQINAAMNFFRAELFKRSPRMEHNLFIDIKLKSKLDADGWCYVEDDDARPREFMIVLNKDIKSIELLTTLAHEMVHVWQYASGKLRQYADGSYRYSKQKYEADTPYLRRPWEGEAYEKEQTLVNLWLNRNTA